MHAPEAGLCPNLAVSGNSWADFVQAWPSWLTLGQMWPNSVQMLCPKRHTSSANPHDQCVQHAKEALLASMFEHVFNTFVARARRPVRRPATWHVFVTGMCSGHMPRARHEMFRCFVTPGLGIVCLSASRIHNTGEVPEILCHKHVWNTAVFGQFHNPGSSADAAFD